MADFDSSLPIRTENNGDVVSRISDGTVTSQLLTVNPDGSINITDNGGSLTVDGTLTVTATDLDIRDLDANQDNVAISDGTDTLEVNADGSINAVVTATDLDIRDLDSAQDSVEVLQATHDNLNANANIQVGNTDVSNGNPVPVSDAGGSLTVDATDLDIRDLAFATDKVDVTGSDVTATVTATDLDIRDLTHVSDSVKIGDGTDFLAINADGSINVVPQEDSGTEIVNYSTATVAGGATSNHDWTSAAASKLYQVFASGSGKMKIEVQIETAAASGTFNTVAVAFNSTATPNMDVTLAKYAAVPNGARVRVIRTNRDNQSQDVYSTIVAIQG